MKNRRVRSLIGIKIIAFIIMTLILLTGFAFKIGLGKNGISFGYLEAEAAGDALTDIAVLDSSSGTLSDYVAIDSDYQVTGYATITATSSSTEQSDYIATPGNYPSYYAKGGSANNHYFAVISDPVWNTSSNKVTNSYTGTMTGDSFQIFNMGNTRASSKINSKVLKIAAIKTVNVSFDYSEVMRITSTDNATNKAEKAYFYYLLTDSASPSITQLKGGVCVANGSSNSASGTDFSLTIEEGKYLYLYFFGYIDTGDCSSSQSGGKKTFNFSYSAEVSNFVVTPQEENYSLVLGCSDSNDALIGSGAIKNDSTTYNIPATGYVNALNEVAGGTRINLSVSSIPSGYIHIGWRNKTLGTDIYSYNYSFSLSDNMEVYALFVPAVTVNMGSNGYNDATYSYITPAGGTGTGANQFVARNSDTTKFYKTLSAAFSDTDTVVLVGNITLNGDFTVPAGKTLSVPWELIGDTATTVLQKSSSAEAVSIYTKATINGVVTLNGNLVASGRQSDAQSINGRAAGKVGQIVIGQNGQINVSSTGRVYAYGMITGQGKINVASGGVVYEFLEVRDVRALRAFLDAAYSHKKAMAFSQFFVKTNEVATTYNVGAKLIAKYLININNIISEGELPVIGSFSTSSPSMFMIRSGSFTKSFSSASPYNNKIIVTAEDGSDVTTGSFSVSATLSSYSVTINTADYYMPLNYCYALVVADGGSFTVNHNYKLLPGAMIDVQDGGTLNIAAGKNLVLYRANDYDFRSYETDSSLPGRGFSAPGYPVAFTKPAGLSYATNNPANVGSAVINIDGTLNAAGGLYVTDQLTGLTTYANGYNNLTGTGTINLTGNLSNGVIYEEAQNGADVTGSSCTTKTVSYVPVRGITNYDTADDDGQTDYSSLTVAAWYGLINDSGVNVWSTTRPVTLSYDANGGTGDAPESVTKLPGAEITVLDNMFTAPEGFVFAGWNTSADGNGTAYAADETITITEDIVLYAQWQEVHVHTWGEPVFEWANDYQSASATFVCTSNASHTVTLLAEVTVAEGEGEDLGYTVYTAVVTGPDGNEYTDVKRVVKTFTITWKNYDGTTLLTETAAYGTDPVYNGETPAKSATSTLKYEFAAWYPELKTVTDNATYTAEFKGVTLNAATQTEDFRINAASLSLFSDLSVNFKAKKSFFANGYSNIYAIITINNEARLIEAEDYDANTYVFRFLNVYARYMNTTIYANLYAEKDGVLYCADTLEYSVAQYAYNKLEKNTGDDMPWLAPMLVDMLNYGSAVQSWAGYRADDLCNAQLTDAQRALGTQNFDVNDLVSVQEIVSEISEPEAAWKAGGLRLGVSVDLRVRFQLADIEGTYVVLKDTVTGTEWRKDAALYAVDSEHNGQYYVYFNTLKLSEMSDELEVRIYNDQNEQISDALHYSIESYVKSKITQNSNPAEADMLAEMIKFGHSAWAYKHRND